MSCNGCRTPEVTRKGKDKQQTARTTGEPPPYCELVGALQYLVSGSRPDIAHVVRKLGEHLSAFTIEHYDQGKRVLRYLKFTRDYGLVMRVKDGNEVDLLVYTDAD